MQNSSPVDRDDPNQGNFTSNTTEESNQQEQQQSIAHNPNDPDSDLSDDDSEYDDHDDFLEDDYEHDEDLNDEDTETEEEEDATTNNEGDKTPKMGCKHYQRKCQVKSPCCQRYFWCRLCHNEQVCENLERHALSKDKSTSDLWCKVEEMDRFSIQYVQCMMCQNEQCIETENNFRNCGSCGTEFAQYACFKCKFYNDDPSAKIFHCDDCGMCRRGVVEDYVHCHTCSACMPKDHMCIAKSLHQNCAVCLEFLFTSTKPSSILPNCGHAMHSHCFKQLMKSGTISCPLCSKSMFKGDELKNYYEQLDAEIQNTPMPDEYKDMKVNILCNDCLNANSVSFHILGHKCPHCGGYNTKRK